MVAVNQANPTDQHDFEKFQSRFKELQEEFSTTLVYHGEQAQPGSPTFKVYTFNVDLTDLDELAKKLTERPGALGWGSMYELIKKHQ